jgi:sugar-specific transcriptional regulator TrmB
MAIRPRPDLDGTTNELIELGLTLNEARCYLALLSSGPATAAELAKISGVPRPKVYATLKLLEQRGFSYPSGDRITRFRAVDPELALNEMARAREHERRLADERERQVRADLIRALPAPPEPAAPDRDEIMRLTGPGEATIAVYERMIDTAKRRVDIVHGLPTLQDPSHFNRFELRALKRGVQVRVLLPDRDLAIKHRIGELIEAGGEARFTDGAPLKLVICDGAEALAALRNPDDTSHPTCVAIGHTDLVTPLQLLFNREWRKAKPAQVSQLNGHLSQRR